MKNVLSFIAVLLMLSRHVPEVRAGSTGIVATFDSSGALISRFDVPLVDNQIIRFVEVDPSGNIWVGKLDEHYQLNQFNPNDGVVEYNSQGTELLTVKSPMRFPTSIAFDSSRNIYIGGLPDGGSLSASQIFKYDAKGNFLNSFGLLSGSLLGAGWSELRFAPGDRLFGTTGNPVSVQEYTVGGALVNLVGSFDGKFRYGLELALTPDGKALWSYQPSNGGGENFLVQYDLNLHVLNSIGLGFLGNPFVQGLEVLSNNDLLIGDFFGNFDELTSDGRLVRSFSLQAPGFPPVSDFTLDGNGDILVAAVASSVPEPSSSTLIALGGSLLLGYYNRSRLQGVAHHPAGGAKSE
jgi:hypothetical protein